MTKLSEGVEIDIQVYMTSESSGIDIKIGLKGFPVVPEFNENQLDPMSFIKSIQKSMDTSKLEALATDWRMMTRAEIKEYKDANPD